MTLELNKIHQMDCLDGMKQLKDCSVDLIVTDPPFNVGYRYEGYDDNKENYWPWTEKWIKACYRALKDNGSIYIKQITPNSFQTGQILKDLGMEFQNLIIWKSIPCFPHRRRFNRQYEVIIFFTKGDDYTFNTYIDEVKKEKAPWGRDRKARSTKLRSDLWLDIQMVYTGTVNHPEAIFKEKGKSYKKAHPCQMPLDLARRMIKFSSNEGDLVLDPFAGSGTVPVAAKQLNRRFLAFEIVPEYMELGRKRLKQKQLMDCEDTKQGKVFDYDDS